MTHRFKTLGVAFFAVFALTAVMASAASAKNYTASSYPTTGTAESFLGNDRLSTEGGAAECQSHYQGTLAASSSSLTVTPTYTNCKAFGFPNATVHMNGCDFLFTTASGTAPNFTAPVDVACPAGKGPIQITAGTCVVDIPAQGPLNSVAITNQANGDMLLKANVTGITYNVTQDGFGCPFFGTGHRVGATYTQANPVTFDATNGANIHVG